MCVFLCTQYVHRNILFFFFKSLLFPVLWFFLIFFFTRWSFHILCALLLFNLLLSIPAPTGFSLRLIVIHSKKKKKKSIHIRVSKCVIQQRIISASSFSTRSLWTLEPLEVGIANTCILLDHSVSFKQGQCKALCVVFWKQGLSEGASSMFLRPPTLWPHNPVCFARR